MADKVDPDLAEQATAAQRAAGSTVGPDDAALAAAAVSGAAPAQVDVKALVARIQALEAAVAAAGVPAGEHPLIATALAGKQQLAIHVDHYGLASSPAGGAALRLADDVTDAARNAVASGDTSVVRELGARMTRALGRIHPGGGDHHYFKQAADFYGDHLQDAADLVTAPAPSAAGAIGSASGPAVVVAGSVTG